VIPKIFTPESASAALPRLRPRAESMRRLYLRLQRRHPGDVHGDRLVDRGYFTTMLQFYEAVCRLRAEGVLIRDPADGALDFPAWREGRPVLLCWCVGEPRVGHWRDPAAGADRRAVDAGPWDPPVEPWIPPPGDGVLD
jgi:hypothetical protein